VLQQVAQREYNATPQYHLLDEKGPDHSKCFKVAAVIGRHRHAAAWGRNKKEAEQKAAMNALAEINGDPIPFAAD
jgi:ribonuclease-3